MSNTAPLTDPNRLRPGLLTPEQTDNVTTDTPAPSPAATPAPGSTSPSPPAATTTVTDQGGTVETQQGVQPPAALDEGALEDDTVSGRLNALLAGDSPLMQQARTRGAQTAARRGLLNSSIGAGAAEAEAIRTALPAAQQDAAQAAQRNIARMNIAANDREKAMAAVVAMSNNYAEVFRTIASNPDIPAGARNQFLEHIANLRDSNFNLIEQMYGVDLQWSFSGEGGSPSGAPAAPAAGATPSGPRTLPGGRVVDEEGNLVDFNPD